MSLYRLLSLYWSILRPISTTETVVYYIVVLYSLAYSISTVVYIHRLHNVPDTSSCREVLPNLREFLRIGGWILLGIAILVTLRYGWMTVRAIPVLIQSPTGWIFLVSFVGAVALGLAVLIISIQYTNTLREASTVASDDTSVKRCLQLAPYRRVTMDTVAWLNIVSTVVQLVVYGGALMVVFGVFGDRVRQVIGQPIIRFAFTGQFF